MASGLTCMQQIGRTRFSPLETDAIFFLYFIHDKRKFKVGLLH